MLHIHDLLEEGLANGIYGPGVKFIKDEIATYREELDALNTYGRPETDRSEENLQRASKSVFGMLRRLRQLPE